jgi:hypothetical protein
VESDSFEFVLRQQRQFKNRYGKSIREDILNLALKSNGRNEHSFKSLGPRVARDALYDSAKIVEKKNQSLLFQALEKAQYIEGTPVFDGSAYEEYQTRDAVIAVKEQGCTTTNE